MEELIGELYRLYGTEVAELDHDQHLQNTCTRKGSASLQDVKMLYLLVRHHRPSCVLDIGTSTGVLLYGIIKAVKRNANVCDIHTIDAKSSYDLPQDVMGMFKFHQGLAKNIVAELSTQAFDMIFTNSTLDAPTASLLCTRVTKNSIFATHGFVPPSDRGIVNLYHALKYVACFKSHYITAPNPECNWRLATGSTESPYMSIFSQVVNPGDINKLCKTSHQPHNINNCVAVLLPITFYDGLNYCGKLVQCVQVKETAHAVDPLVVLQQGCSAVDDDVVYVANDQKIIAQCEIVNITSPPIRPGDEPLAARVPAVVGIIDCRKEGRTIITSFVDMRASKILELSTRIDDMQHRIDDLKRELSLYHTKPPDSKHEDIVQTEQHAPHTIGADIHADSQNVNTCEYLVTGCAGFIGSHVCEYLLNKGHVVAGIDNINSYYSTEQKLANVNILRQHAELFSFYNEDVLETDCIKKLRPKYVIHLASMAGVRYSIEQPEIYVRNNIEAFVRLMRHSIEFGVERVIYASSSSVYGLSSPPFKESDPILYCNSPYACSKYSMEVFAKMYSQIYGISVVGLRFFTVYGPRGRPDMAPDKFLRAIDTGAPVNKFGSGDTSRDYTYIDDVVSGVIAAAHAKDIKCDVFNIGNNKPVTLNEFIRTCECVCEKPAIVEACDMQTGDVPHTCADISHSKSKLGFSPKIQLREGLHRTLVYMRSSRPAESASTSLPRIYCNTDLIKYTQPVHAVMSEAQKNVEEGKPFLLIRIGDGELSLIDPIVPTSLKENMYCVHLGYVPDNNTDRMLSSNLIRAITGGDYIGVCTKSNMSGLWKSSYEALQRCIPTFGQILQNKRLCDMVFHHRLNKVSEIHLLRNIIHASKKVVIISSRDVVREMSRYFEIDAANIQLLSIPGEHKYEESTNSDSKLIWTEYDKIIAEIKAEPRSCQLCLFGTGMAAKDLGLVFKEAGGVALDMGSVFDMWYGKKTRGEGKGKTAYTTPYLSTIPQTWK